MVHIKNKHDIYLKSIESNIIKTYGALLIRRTYSKQDTLTIFLDYHQ